MIVIDGKGHILGRIGTFIAKRVLLGEEVVLLNCSQVMITGRKREIMDRYAKFRRKGIPVKGPFYSRRADFFVKRAIRGMLPYKRGKGISALKNIRCYVGIPKQFQEMEKTSIKEAHISKLPNLKYIQVGEICKHLGGKI